MGWWEDNGFTPSNGYSSPGGNNSGIATKTNTSSSSSKSSSSSSSSSNKSSSGGSSSSGSSSGGITQTSSGWSYGGRTYSNLSDALSAAGAAGYGGNANNNTYGSDTTQWYNPTSGQAWTGYSNGSGQQTNQNGTPIVQQPPILPPPVMPQMPTVPTIPPFQAPAQNQMSFDQAQSQVKGQLDPLYSKALQNIQRQKYQNQLNAGELAKNKGLGHSGLAADLQNKVNLQAQQDISNADLDKQSKIASMAQALQQQDFNNYQNTYSNALNTWLNNSNMAINQYKLGAQLSQWQQEQKAQQDALDFQKKLQQAIYTGRFYLD